MAEKLVALSAEAQVTGYSYQQANHQSHDIINIAMGKGRL
jgi:hypothetical protein